VHGSDSDQLNDERSVSAGDGTKGSENTKS
jgi:hypothetical protein